MTDEPAPADNHVKAALAAKAQEGLALFELVHGPVQREGEDTEAPDFDGGAHDRAPANENPDGPEASHNEFIVALGLKAKQDSYGA